MQGPMDARQGQKCLDLRRRRAIPRPLMLTSRTRRQRLAAEGLFNRLAEAPFVGRVKTDPNSTNRAFAVEQHGGREGKSIELGGNDERLLRLRSRILIRRDVAPQLSEKLLGLLLERGSFAAAADRKELKIRLRPKVFLQLDEAGKLQLARTAPRRPKVDQRHLAGQARAGHRL